jgi:hypothetical protein
MALRIVTLPELYAVRPDLFWHFVTHIAGSAFAVLLAALNTAFCVRNVLLELRADQATTRWFRERTSSTASD